MGLRGVGLTGSRINGSLGKYVKTLIITVHDGLTGSNRITSLTKAAATAPKGVRLMRRARHGASPRTHQAPRNEASDRAGRARSSFEHPLLGQALVADVLNSACEPTLRSPEPSITGSFYLQPTR